MPSLLLKRDKIATTVTKLQKLPTSNAIIQAVCKHHLLVHSGVTTKVNEPKRGERIVRQWPTIAKVNRRKKRQQRGVAC